MGFFHSCSFCLSTQSSTAFFFLILIFIFLSSTHARFMPQGESNLKQIHMDTTQIQVGNGELERRSVLIGSRPPRCEKGYCRNCGRCEAIQVPISPRTTHQALGTTSRSIVDSRGDDISNYKPMCWKCKCGDFIFNP